MDYSNFTKEELIQKIEELQMLNRQLLEEQEQRVRLDFAWTGNLGHWYWNIKSNNVTFNPLKITALGYTEDEISENVTYQFFTEKLHPDDYDKTMDAMISHLSGRTHAYEVEYRIQTKQGDYRWYYDRGRITKYDKDGKPAFLAGIVFDITEKKEKELELERENRILAEQSSTDNLTGLNNRRALIEFLRNQIDTARQEKTPVSLAIFDIDDFKKVNDSKGHLYGDKVLKIIADIMSSIVRESDIVGRYGGEEFMVVFPGTGLKEALATAERIRKSIESHQFDGNDTITVSGGVKEYMGEELSEFINAADMNLYEAKRRGKNQII